MFQRSLEAIAKAPNNTKEKIVPYLLIVLRTVLILPGIGVYFYIGQLTIVQKVYATSTTNFMMSQLKLLCDFARVLGVVFSLIGVVSVIFALDRLTFSKESYRMALYIDSLQEEQLIKRAFIKWLFLARNIIISMMLPYLSLVMLLNVIAGQG